MNVPVNFSRPFIERPIGTTLMALGLFLAGAVAYFAMPVASMPAVEFPTIRVTASRPGADPATMAASVAAPLERRLGEIAGVTEMTSTSSLGSTQISLQFDLSRNIDGAARDVQAALNAATADLPGDLPQVPTFRKANPAAAPVLILALTSKTMAASGIYDVADTVIAQRISQVEGVADVTVSGAAQPATRIQVDPSRLAALNISFEEVRTAIAAANDLAPLGAIESKGLTITLQSSRQLSRPEDYAAIVVKARPNAEVVRLGDVAKVELGTRNVRSEASFNRDPAVLLLITKQPAANVIDTVDGVKNLLPVLKQWIPANVEIAILSDRTGTIRASVHDMQYTLGLTALLVMSVVLVFLRRLTPTIAAGISVPLSLAGTCACMWAAGFSIDNLSLMALAIAVGFVVDDAIVMIENVHRNIERGATPKAAALAGAGEIGFTVISISVSLVAAFIPVLFMTGIVGRLLHEFALTLTFAILISAAVSLTVTPMICAKFMRAESPARQNLLDRLFEGSLALLVKGYAATLRLALRHEAVMIATFIATIVLTVHYFIVLPKGYLPQDDTGLVMASTEASADISFETMASLQRQALDVVLADPAVAAVGASVGAGGPNPTGNQGRMFISLKPREERGGLATALVIDRLRGPLSKIAGLETRLMSAQDVRTGARQGKAQYQFTLWGLDVDQLYEFVPKALSAIRAIPGLADVTSDREQGGLELAVKIDREAAARLGVPIGNIDDALANAFSQRQISTIYADRNQYKVVLEVDPALQRDPADLEKIHVPGEGGVAVPLASLVHVTKDVAPLVVNHQGSFPAVTINYNLKPGMTLAASLTEIDAALLKAGMPSSIRAEPAGDAKSFVEQSRMQNLLIIAALLAIYIVLGVLYESLIHPLTIISTLPSAGLGALLALKVADMEISVIALIGLILLIGLVKKNGIILVDFALDAERRRGLAPADAIYEACLERFRPILMTTLAALLGAVPLALAVGAGSELRRPLGITIIGGLLVSQVLTLYTTPAIYILLERLRARVLALTGRRAAEPSDA